MKRTSKRVLALLMALLMLASAFPLVAFPATAVETASEQTKEWTDEDYASLYVTKGLLFKWDAFDLEANEVVTELVNQVAGGKNVALGKKYKGKSNIELGADATLVGTASNGNEKNVVHGNKDAQNLVADSTIDTKGALLTSSALDFTDIQPWQTLESGEKVLADVTFEVTMYQQNYYPTGLVHSATLFGPFASSRCINDNNVTAPDPLDESYGFISHATLGFMRKGTTYGAWNMDKSSEPKVFGNYRLQTYTVGVLFDYTVSQNATVEKDVVTGTFLFDYYRDGKATNVTEGWQGDYYALQSGGNSSNAHNKFHFGGNLPFAYRAIRMYDRALTEAEMAQNHAAELLDYYRVDLTKYMVMPSGGRKNINEALRSYRLGETSKEEIEAIFNSEFYNKNFYDYSDLYVQDGLLFLWTGEDNQLGTTEQKVTTFENLVGDQHITKETSGRMESQFYTPQDFAANYKTDKGVIKVNDTKFIYTDLVPTRQLGDATVLSDMTLEVSQAYPSLAKTTVSSTTVARRYYDTGAVFLGPLSFIRYNKMPYGTIIAKNEEGASRYFLPFYYIPNATEAAPNPGKEVLWADISGSHSTKQAFSLYRQDASGVMKVATVDSYGQAIKDVYLDPTISKNDVYMSTATGKLYYTYDPYFENTSKRSNVALNINGLIQGGTNIPATMADGYGPMMGWNDSPFNRYFDYAIGKYANFMNAYQDEQFTTSLIFDYNDNATNATSIPYTFIAGRDGVAIQSLAATYNSTKKYANGFSAEQVAQGANDKYGFSYGIGVVTIYYSIRLYDRALSDEEQAQNHFVDVAMQVDADLYDYFFANQRVKDHVHQAVAGTAASDWTADALEALIDEAIDTLAPYYYEFYVQDGLTFLWSGEKFTIGSSEKTVSALTNLLTPSQSINGTTWGRQAYNLIDKNGVYRALSYKVVDGGVILDKDYRPILTDLVPYTVIDGKEVLTDMTLEISQSYFDTVKTSTSGATFASTRGNDGGQAWYGPFGTVSHAKSVYNAMYVGGKTYYYFLYKDADGNFHTIYRNQTSSDGLKTYKLNNVSYTLPLYTYDEAENKMVEIVDEELLTKIRETYVGKNSQGVDTTYMKNIWKTETLQHTSLSFDNNSYAGIVATDAYGTIGVQSHSLSPFSSYDKYGAKQFLNNTVNEAFTSATVYNYRDTAITTKLDFSLVRDGQVLGTTAHDYNAGTDKSKGYTSSGVYYGFCSDSSATTDHSKYYGGTAEPGKDEGRNFAFTLGVTTQSLLHSIRVYNRALSNDEMAQNNFIDIAMNLKLDLSAYAKADEANKALVHNLTKGHDAGDFEADELQTTVDAILAGGQEVIDILASDAVLFDGYAIRVVGDAGLRAVFTLDKAFIETASANESATIKEIGAIVAIKGDYVLEDLTIAGGRQMTKEAVYANGAYTTNGSGAEQTYVRKEDGATCFALTTLFDGEDAKTKEFYETELLYRGYITIAVGEEEFTFYTDMTAPSYDKISMYDVTKVFEAHGYANYKTVKDVLAVCEPTA